MAPEDAFRDDGGLRASDTRGEFSREFIAEVQAAERECEMGQCQRFENVDDLLTSLDE